MNARPSDSPFPDLHTVVFDVNIYLDVAELLGPPFDWGKFQDAVIRHGFNRVPHRDQRVDSLRAVSMVRNGRFAGQDLVEVWTSNHILNLVELKACQPIDGPTPEQTGLGWTLEQAADLRWLFVVDLVWEQTGGGAVNRTGVDGHPPLSHEDASVYTAGRYAADERVPPPLRYCVTHDRGFRKAQGLDPQVQVLYAHEFVDLVQRSRRAVAMRTMRPGR